MRYRLFLAGLIFFFLGAAAAQSRDPDGVIRPTVTDTRLAVADFSPRVGANPETQTALKVFNQVLWNDLEFSGFFRMPSKSFYPLQPMRVPQDVEFERWQVPTLDVDFLVFGSVHADSSAVVEAFLYDVKTREQVLGKRFTVADPELIRRVAHEFADQVVFQLSAGASQGVARTRIAFSSDRGGSKEILEMDYDGANLRTVTANGGINKFPHYSPDNSKLGFITNLPGSARWELWLQDLQGGRTVLPTPTSYVSSPAISPDGRSIAYSAREQGRRSADIFVSSLDGTGTRNLTQHDSIDTAPTWSPTGRQIAFVSDRSGTAQVWVMESDGTNVRRLVQEGGHCDSPDWSPDGRYVAYSWRAPQQWGHNIYVVEVATGRIFQLTSGRGNHESPSWSPDGRHIAFQNDRSGTKQIFIMNADGKNLKQITAYGINEGPTWSSYPPQTPGDR